MEEFRYNDKKYIRVGVVLILIVLISIIAANYYWTPKPNASLSCLSVQSRINNLIELERSTKDWGAPAAHKARIEKDVKSALSDNKKLNCGFNESQIRRQFKF